MSIQEAKTTLFSSSVSHGTTNTYRNQFNHFIRHQVANGRDVLMDGSDPVASQEAIVDFIATKGLIEGYAHATVHVMLYAIKHYLIMNRCPDRTLNAPLIKVAMKGLKNLQGGSVQKVAATLDLLLEALRELDLNVWDDLVVALALSLMFVFLLRCREALGPVEPETCLRVGNFIVAAKEEQLPVVAYGQADELVLLQGKSKADQQAMGHMANAFRADHPLSPVSLFQRAAWLNPAHFADADRYLLTKANGKVLSRDEISKRLRSAGERCGVPRAALSAISLRSGGASAMFHEGYSAEEIKRRGRWASDCWRTYV